MRKRMSIDSQVKAPNTDELWETIETVFSKYQGVKSNSKKFLMPVHSHCLFIEMGKGDYAGEWLFKSTGDIFKAMGDNEFIDAIGAFSQKDYLISVYDK